LKIRILVVDDEQDNCDYLKALLSKEGFDVITLTDPRQTVEILKRADFHLVILDMMMPQMSGTDVLEEIRKMDSDVAVIINTAYPTVDTAVASLKAQASDYVRKPLEPVEFIASVRRALARKGLYSDPEAELHRAIGITIRDARIALQDRLSSAPHHARAVRRSDGAPHRNALAEDDENIPLLDWLGLLAADLLHDPALGCFDRHLHLHRLEDHQGLTSGNRLADRNLDLPNGTSDVRGNVCHGVLLACNSRRAKRG